MCQAVQNEEHAPPGWAHLISTSARTSPTWVHLPAVRNLEARGGAHAEEHDPGRPGACIKKRVPSRWAHFMPRSARTTTVRARLPSTCNPGSQLRARALEHAYGHRRAWTEEHMPFRQAHLMSKSMRMFSTSVHLQGAQSRNSFRSTCRGSRAWAPKCKQLWNTHWEAHALGRNPLMPKAQCTRPGRISHRAHCAHPESSACPQRHCTCMSEGIALTSCTLSSVKKYEALSPINNDKTSSSVDKYEV